MSHELVSRFNDAGKIEHLMCSATEDTGWHGLARVISNFDEAVDFCDFNRKLTCHNLVIQDLGTVLPDRRAICDSSGRYIGTVGPDYQIHQDTDLVKLARTYMDTGLVDFDTCGMLLGGARIWISLKVKQSECEIKPGDYIKSNIFLAQGHDMSLAVVQGTTDIRIVCNNMLGMTLREVGHTRTRHLGNVAATVEEASKKILESLENRRARVEVFQKMATTRVTGKEVTEYVAKLTGKETGRAGGPANRILTNFMNGIGTRGETWWDLLNAVTEDVTHNLANNCEGDSIGDREGRALNKMFFGSGAKMLDTAYALATKMMTA